MERINVFSDEDLKRLKDWEPVNSKPIELRDVEALLARLEAAEWAMQVIENQEHKGYLNGDLVAPLEAWRKASGKDGANDTH